MGTANINNNQKNVGHMKGIFIQVSQTLVGMSTPGIWQQWKSQCASPNETSQYGNTNRGLRRYFQKLEHKLTCRMPRFHPEFFMVPEPEHY